MDRNTKETALFDALLLLTACIWGLAFSAQRQGMNFMGPFTYNGVRFLLGTLFLLIFKSIKKLITESKLPATAKINPKSLVWPAVTGLILFVASNAQQAGMVWTTAGNAGFITSFYVVFVPFASFVLGKKILGSQWISAFIAIAGLFLIGGGGIAPLNPGDFLVFLSAIFWTAHVLMVERGVKKSDPVDFSLIQFLVCGIVSFVIGIVLEKPDWTVVIVGWWTIVYGGIFSVGIAYTLQVVAQTKVPAAHAVVLLSLESVFAFGFGALLLGERLGLPAIIGGILIFMAVIISQSSLFRQRSSAS